jgi:hypothetical protein
MRDPDSLIQGILDDTIAIKELSATELDLVIEGLTDVAEGLLETEHHEVGVAMLKALDLAVDMHTITDEFEQAIVDAEARGSVYWEFDEYTIH